MGVKVSRTGVDTYTFRADEVDTAYLESQEFLQRCSKLRGSVMLVGPLLTRFGRALISKPGGDKIGRRRLDTHFLGISNWEQNSLMIQPEVFSVFRQII